MTNDFGADSRSHPTGQARAGLGASRFDQGDEAWRDALIAFYELDELPTKAARLRAGEPLDYLDRRTICALQAAVRQVKEAA